MSRLRLILRWVAALAAAVIVHVAVLASGSVLWQHFGGDIVTAVTWMASIGSFATVLVGTIILPRKQWRIGAFVIWMLSAIFYLPPFWGGHVAAKDIYVFGSALTGGWFGYLPMALLAGQAPIFGWKPQRRGGKVRPVLASLVGCALLIFAATELYFAWRYHAVNGKYEDWISYEEHPIEFWLYVSLWSLLLALPLFAILFFLFSKPKAKARPPIETVIRRSASER